MLVRDRFGQSFRLGADQFSESEQNARPGAERGCSPSRQRPPERHRTALSTSVASANSTSACAHRLKGSTRSDVRVLAPAVVVPPIQCSTVLMRTPTPPRASVSEAVRRPRPAVGGPAGASARRVPPARRSPIDARRRSTRCRATVARRAGRRGSARPAPRTSPGCERRRSLRCGTPVSVPRSSRPRSSGSPGTCSPARGQ